MLERWESPKEALWFPVPVTGLCVDRGGGVTETGGALSDLHPPISPALSWLMAAHLIIALAACEGKRGGWFQWQVTPESSGSQEVGLSSSEMGYPSSLEPSLLKPPL